ncbi:MAG TPA: alcohol dehydrogenase catalytic domain-containing protein [Dehalococcoidia bacterium]|nr:alcohol dehydrogenase catalytic domain-containing protein [Dehalococcoidia bacterium]
MRESYWTDTGIALRDAKPGHVAPGFVRLRVAACGICGSDLHRYKDTGGSALGREVTPGHEFVGTIVDANGANLPDALYGVDPWQACGTCDYCLRGQSEACRSGRLVGVHVPGGFADEVDVPLRNVHAQDPSLSAVEASLNEPFAVCVRTIHLAELKLDTRVLIIGGGTLGLICGALARDFAGRVAMTYRYPHQAEAARRIGIEAVAEADTPAFAKDFEPDVVIESVGGTANTIEQAMAAARVGGLIVVQGLFSKPSTIDASTFVFKELRMAGSKIYGQSYHSSEFGVATQLLPRHLDTIKVLQTHQFPLDEIDDAFVAAADKARNPIKVTVVANS